MLWERSRRGDGGGSRLWGEVMGVLKGIDGVCIVVGFVGVGMSGGRLLLVRRRKKERHSPLCRLVVVQTSLASLSLLLFCDSFLL